MELDLRHPTLVVTGAWNPAIFQPAWIASQLFEIALGEEIELVELLTAVGAVQRRRIDYIRAVGISVDQGRLELYLNSFEEPTQRIAEQVLSKVFEKLPHTPFGAFGVNFQFRQQDPDDPIVDSLKTADRIDQNYILKEQAMRATIVFENDIDLNFTRTIKDAEAVFSFNYHHGTIRQENYADLIRNCISRYLAHSTQTLRDLYGLEQHTYVTHNFDEAAVASGGENINGPENEA